MSDQVKHLYVLADDLREKGYQIEKGLAMAVHSTLLGKPSFYPSEATLGRDYDIAMKERITDAMEQRLINKGRFNDRKPRFAGLRRDPKDNSYIIAVGPTHFEETKATTLAGIKNRRVYTLLRQDGQMDHGDPRAYFAYNFAANTVPVSDEGYALAFRRSPNAEIYPNHWHTIGGMIDTDFSFWNKKDPSIEFRYMIDERMLKELKEELGVLPSELSLELTGLVDGFSTVDFTYAARIFLPAEEMLRRGKSAEDAADHTKTKILRTPGEVHDFLLSSEPLVPDGVGGMLLYLKGRDRDAYDSAVQKFSAYHLGFE